MTGFQIIQALLTITEISGLFYLFFLMYERRSGRLWSSLLLGSLIAGFCASAIFQRGEVAMYSRYFMLLRRPFPAAAAGRPDSAGPFEISGKDRIPVGTFFLQQHRCDRQ